MGVCTSQRNKVPLSSTTQSSLISPQSWTTPRKDSSFYDDPNESVIVERESFYSELIDTIDICVIGNNEMGELGLGHTKNVESLTVLNSIPKSHQFSHQNIEIHSGYKFSIYTNISAEYEQNYHWAAGANHHGECCFGINNNASKCNAIQWFKSNDIGIKKICVSIGGQCVFWISNNNNTVYANGGNDYGQLGLNDTSTVWSPKLVPFFDGYEVSNVRDIQCAKNYSIALCTTDYNHIITIIIRHLAMEFVHNQLPKCILDLIVTYYRIHNVYSTEFSKYGGNGHEFVHRWNKWGEVRTNWSWKEILTLKDRDIVKIKTGRNHTLLLDTKGIVWACGINVNGGLGLGHCNDVYEPEMIKWFIENDNNIKIVDIECGSDHNLCLDTKGRVYSFGANNYGQCGDSSTQFLSKPKMIKYFKGRKVLKIDCGSNHSYCLVEKECMNERNEHYLFGSNKCNECITYDNAISNSFYNVKVSTPHCVNNIIEEKSGGKSIEGVYLGHHNTKIILVDM